MKLIKFLMCTLLCLTAQLAPAQDRDAVVLVLVGHASVPKFDVAMAQRLFTGRAVEVGGVAVTVFNAAPGTKLRERFLSTVVKMDEDRYVAYWTVRKHVGKGTPPRDLASAAEIVEHVIATPGAVCYVMAADLKPGMNVLLRL